MSSQCTPTSRARLPEWLRLKLPTSKSFTQTRALLGNMGLHTVCESAQCPNHWECWSKGTATFMIAGDRCTRSCKFCAVTTAPPLPLDAGEPARVAEAVQQMKLKHVVITSVTRDDLGDGGARHFRQTVEAVRSLNPGVMIEILVPDFQDQDAAIDDVLASQPNIFNHNLETVRRLTPQVRSKATYERSLSVLQKARQRAGQEVLTKSGLMLGLGETEEEVRDAMTDLRSVGCDILTLGQYLQPSPKNLPVAAYIPPERFTVYAVEARRMGFLHAACAPMVRSSYHADEVNLSRQRSALI